MLPRTSFDYRLRRYLHQSDFSAVSEEAESFLVQETADSTSSAGNTQSFFHTESPIETIALYILLSEQHYSHIAFFHS
ncbi:MAG: hypothetical protein II979_04625, partial [Clostridia bacterium]|nr:hypothetical protein [Clostridia bacterium]